MTALTATAPRLTDENLSDDWLDQLFVSRPAVTHGIVSRPVREVEREIGVDALEREVRRRGYHLMRTHRHFLIVCDARPLQLIC